MTVFYDPADLARMSIDDQDDEGWFSVHVRIGDEDTVLRRAVLLPSRTWREVGAQAQRPGGPCWVARSRGRRLVLAISGGSDL